MNKLESKYKSILSDYPSLFKINEIFRMNHRFSANIIDRCIPLFGEKWLVNFEKIVSSMFTNEDAVAAAVKGYSNFAINSMRLQAEFERTRKYKAKSYEQTSSEVYFNERHMMEEYLPGLLLSHFLWPHHYRQLQFFEGAFISEMRVANADSFVEVGIGTGLYSALLLRNLPDIRGVGIDISPSSKKFTEVQLAGLGVSDRYRVELRDITATESPDPKASWIVCVEVLEHLDDPVAFLRSLRLCMAPGAKAFITAAVNAAHSDHIHLYRNGNEVLDHLNEAGFTMEQCYIGAAYKPTSVGVPVPEAAAFIVY